MAVQRRDQEVGRRIGLAGLSRPACGLDQLPEEEPLVSDD